MTLPGNVARLIQASGVRRDNTDSAPIQLSVATRSSLPFNVSSSSSVAEVRIYDDIPADRQDPDSLHTNTRSAVDKYLNLFVPGIRISTQSNKINSTHCFVSGITDNSTLVQF